MFIFSYAKKPCPGKRFICERSESVRFRTLSFFSVPFSSCLYQAVCDTSSFCCHCMCASLSLRMSVAAHRLAPAPTASACASSGGRVRARHFGFRFSFLLVLPFPVLLDNFFSLFSFWDVVIFSTSLFSLLRSVVGLLFMCMCVRVRNIGQRGFRPKVGLNE